MQRTDMTNHKREQMHLYRDKKTKRVLALFAPALASVLLAACGSSSKTPGNAAAVTSAPKAPATRRFAALRECMQKQGVTLPKPVARKPGQAGPPNAGGFPLGPGGARQLPKGVTQAQFQAALRKCGGNLFPSRGGSRAGFGRVSSPTLRKALAKFAACLHENGVAVPAPNTSGNGPIFSTKGLNVTSPKFKAAQKKCSSLLRISPGASATGAPPGGGAPLTSAG
jgi:hypothetical protein